MLSVNERITELIQERDGITQKALGNAIGVPPSTIHNWLRLGRSVPAEYIKPIADCLGVTCEYLLTGKETDEMSKEDSELLSTFHCLPDEAKPVIKNMIKGYLKK